MSRVDELKQRLQKVAYKGMANKRNEPHLEQKNTNESDFLGDFIQKDFNKEGTRKEILDKTNKDDLQLKSEVTCGPSSQHCRDNVKNTFEEYKETGIEDKAKMTGGYYEGPGAENSFKRINIKPDEKPSVGHVWLELPDKTIVDPSAGQFIDPKHGPLKQRQRFRIVPKESGLHKYYKKSPKAQHMIDRDSKQMDVIRKLRKMGLSDKKIFGRKAKLKQRLSRLQQ